MALGYLGMALGYPGVAPLLPAHSWLFSRCFRGSPGGFGFRFPPLAPIPAGMELQELWEKLLGPVPPQEPLEHWTNLGVIQDKARNDSG